MKYMEIPMISKVNQYFSKISPTKIELEVYSCKKTKSQKKYAKIPKPLRYYIVALESTFPDYCFSDLDISNFVPVSLKYIRQECAFQLSIAYKNNLIVEQDMFFLDIIIRKCINIRSTSMLQLDFFSVDLCNAIFILHNKKQKRIILIKLKGEEARDML